MVHDSGFLELCNRASKAATEAIVDFVGTAEANRTLYQGADGTATKVIDEVAENAIFEVLKSDGRSMRIVSEEFGEKIFGNNPEFSVLLDPLDGTYNAAFGIPCYCVSIAIGDPDLSNTQFGYVRNLADGETYHAEYGKHAYLNGKRIKTSDNSNLNEFCISVYECHPKVQRTTKLCKKVRRIRILGSVALELCYVASGKIDAFIDVRGALRLTDVAAGKFIVEESGGVVTNSLGAGLKLPDSFANRVDMIASNGCAHMEILKLSARR
ncbi:MAG: bifunctional fructose-bisphosphatase/inositol-phosphate phosphatase [Methanosarcinaceae archaeon]|nr:bifunctional fructose-bisphosphatase/inositol-phosphate phosphatase [Methanosarcinaceae archaeon]